MRSFIFIQLLTISAWIDRCAINLIPPLSLLLFTIIRESYDLDNFIINCSVIFCQFLLWCYANVIASRGAANERELDNLSWFYDTCKVHCEDHLIDLRNGNLQCQVISISDQCLCTPYMYVYIHINKYLHKSEIGNEQTIPLRILLIRWLYDRSALSQNDSSLVFISSFKFTREYR